MQGKGGCIGPPPIRNLNEEGGYRFSGGGGDKGKKRDIKSFVIVFDGGFRVFFLLYLHTQR